MVFLANNFNDYNIKVCRYLAYCRPMHSYVNLVSIAAISRADVFVIDSH